MYGKRPELSDFDRRMGFTEADFDESYELLECTADSWAFFLQVCRQWRMGPSGPIGLDYTVLPMMFDLWGIDSREERRWLMADLQIIETAALNQMAENRTA